VALLRFPLWGVLGQLSGALTNADSRPVGLALGAGLS